MTGHCPRCGGSLSRGFVLDLRRHATGHVSQWVEGEPVKSFWSGINLRGRRKLPIEAYRCDGCGFVELYAPSTPADA